jgi:hypothetical protein
VTVLSDETMPDFFSKIQLTWFSFLGSGQKEAILPLPDSNGQFTLSLDVISDWRDRLVTALSQLALARHLWIADSLNFGLPDLDKFANDALST